MSDRIDTKETTMTERTYRHRTTTRYPGRDVTEGGFVRESYYVGLPGRGAVEGWRTPSTSGSIVGDYYGGVEVHALAPMYVDQPRNDRCAVLGGPCYHDGSSLAYTTIAGLFDRPDQMFAHLDTWADDYLTTKEGEER